VSQGIKQRPESRLGKASYYLKLDQFMLVQIIMPIRIFDRDLSSENRLLELLMPKEWDLGSQMEEFEEWLATSSDSLPSGDLVADLGFTPRPNASSGGGVFTVESLSKMAELGMELRLSEFAAV